MVRATVISRQDKGLRRALFRFWRRTAFPSQIKVPAELSRVGQLRVIDHQKLDGAGQHATDERQPEEERAEAELGTTHGIRTEGNKENEDGSGDRPNPRPSFTSFPSVQKVNQIRVGI